MLALVNVEYLKKGILILLDIWVNHYFWVLWQRLIGFNFAQNLGKMRKRQKMPFDKYNMCLCVSILLLMGCCAYLLVSVHSHDESNGLCQCVLCVNDGISGENEYLYNRYLVLISILWVTVLSSVYCGIQVFVRKH